MIRPQQTQAWSDGLNRMPGWKHRKRVLPGQTKSATGWRILFKKPRPIGMRIHSKNSPRTSTISPTLTRPRSPRITKSDRSCTRILTACPKKQGCRSGEVNEKLRERAATLSTTPRRKNARMTRHRQLKTRCQTFNPLRYLLSRNLKNKVQYWSVIGISVHLFVWRLL